MYGKNSVLMSLYWVMTISGITLINFDRNSKKPA